MAQLGFDATTVAPTIPFDPVPAGKYLAVIAESSMDATKDGRGSYLKLLFEIIEGDCKGRKLTARLNLVNASDQAVAIARAELSAICRAVGVMKPNDSVELHNLPLVIIVACKKRKDSTEIDNEIKGYEPRNPNPPAAMSPPGPGQPGPQAAAPWNRPAPPAGPGAMPPR